MNSEKKTGQAILWVGILGLVLLLAGSLFYALKDSGRKYEPTPIQQAAREIANDQSP